jgi:hypothetical protein
MDLTGAQNEGSCAFNLLSLFELTTWACLQFESIFAAAGRGIYIPLVPPEARASLHFALASFMKTAAKLCSSLRIFRLQFSAGKGVLSGKATPPLCPPRGTKGITH